MCLIAKSLSAEGKRALQSRLCSSGSDCDYNKKTEMPGHIRPGPWDSAFTYNNASARCSSASVL
jgi:hypothetical protein